MLAKDLIRQTLIGATSQMPLLNSDGYWYYDTQGSRNEEFIREHRAVSMVTRIKDWDADPIDYYLIEFKSVVSLNLANIAKTLGLL